MLKLESNEIEFEYLAQLFGNELRNYNCIMVVVEKENSEELYVVEEYFLVDVNQLLGPVEDYYRELYITEDPMEDVFIDVYMWGNLIDYLLNHNHVVYTSNRLRQELRDKLEAVLTDDLARSYQYVNLHPWTKEITVGEKKENEYFFQLGYRNKEEAIPCLVNSMAFTTQTVESSSSRSPTWLCR